ncbi:MAG: Ig-like domain-containing protein [Deltaproteobacteria bacterium]|nr:Ig-like domain-containing protein [Deltaproteobacteria bacterium]
MVAGLAFHAACTDTESATNLNPAGPPMIEQVVLTEAQIDNMGNENDGRIFAFGTLPGLDPSMQHAVTSAAVSGQHLRIVFDEILKGNRLEEISCRANVGPDGAFDKIPDGATPDDVAHCSVAQDALKASCTGDHAVCLCQLDGGCLIGTTMIAKGDPVGVLDVNQDGAADMHRFIPTSVALTCGTTKLMADPAKSYWYPSGDQQPPAMGGIEAIGPAIVFFPSGAVPTNQTCSLSFDPSVVDKTDIQICAPVGGRTADCSGNLDLCSQNCTPGDVSAFSFKTAPLTLAATFDVMGTDKTQPLVLQANTLLDMASLTASVSMTQAGANFTGFTVSISNGGGRSQVTVSPTAGMWQANTMYTLTFSTALKDTAGSPLPAPITISFTTGA